MNFSEYLNFLCGDAFFQVPFIEAMTAMMSALSLGAMLVGMWRELHGGGRSAPPAQPGQQRKAA
jgi:hypothetical protein